MSTQYIVICKDDDGIYVQTTRRRFMYVEDALNRLRGYAPSRHAVYVEVPAVEVDEEGYPLNIHSLPTE